MKQLLIISGKGGTGKTTLLSSFAALADRPVIADCDVDASDLHLILNPTITSKDPFYAQKADQNMEKCSHCGLCREHCRFAAVDEKDRIDTLLCEGCGVCVEVCPTGAITMKDDIAGYSYLSRSRFGPMSHGELLPGGETSGQLVTRVKNNAQNLANKAERELILIDGSPGMGCPVIASLANVDLALLVTEPTLSGIHDLKRIYGVANHFGVPSQICINKWDLNEENSKSIARYAKEKGIGLAGKVSYSKLATKAMLAGKSVVELTNGRIAEEIASVWEAVQNKLSIA
ncbi:MAG: ATP-binding protein [Candidatus Acetothermia bacterium]